MYFLSVVRNFIKLFLKQKMAKNRDADVAMKLDMSLNDFKIMKIEALRDFLSLRNKSTDGDFETLVSRCVLCFLPNFDKFVELLNLNFSRFRTKYIINF